ncbi:MAG: hypothetical protein R3E89_09385 [Thiolinea sp.]
MTEQHAMIDHWLSRLTPQQKVYLLVGMGVHLPGAFATEQEEKVPGAAGSTYPVPELGIPSMILCDGPAGVRIEPTRAGTEQTFYCTAFSDCHPAGLQLGPRAGQCCRRGALGEEAREYGIDVMLMPGMNLHVIRAVGAILSITRKTRI